MKKQAKVFRSLFILLAVVLFSSCYRPQIIPAEPTSEDKPADTPNATMTAIFAIVESLTAQPTNTAVPPTETPVPATLTPTVAPSNTAVPTATVTSTPLFTSTSTKVPTVVVTTIPSRGVVFNATYLATAPTLDGVWDEWTSKQYPMGALIYGSSNWTGEADLEGSFRVGWNNQYLFLAVKVKDDVYVQNASGADLYKGDMVEMLFDANLQGDFYTRSLSPDDYQLGLSPGNPDTNGTKEAYLYYPSSLAGKKDSVIIAAVSQDGLYRMEAAIPWSLLNITPAAGGKFGFALRASDNDNPSKNEQQSMVSVIPGNVLTDPTTWAELWLK